MARTPRCKTTVALSLVGYFYCFGRGWKRSNGMTFLLIASYPDSLLRFRGQLLDDLRNSGLNVHVAAPNLPPGCSIRAQLEKNDINVHEIPLRRTGLNPLFDIILLFRLCLLMRNIQPVYSFSYTIKPVIYGSIAAWLMRVPRRFAMITGLGFVFSAETTWRSGFLRFLVQMFYRHALSKIEKVFFQNPDDEHLFRSHKILETSIPSIVVNGSGVDLDVFRAVPLPNRPIFLLIARLLGSKGVREYVQAAEIVKKEYPEVDFNLVGWIDENPDSIHPDELAGWQTKGNINYIGQLSDVRPALAQCSVYVLPSYREGTPRTVLEAMAMGRAIITTDTPGCRETVVNGKNGFLIPEKSVDELVSAMKCFIENAVLVNKMGKCSRKLAEEKYDVHKVNALMLNQMGIS